MSLKQLKLNFTYKVPCSSDYNCEYSEKVVNQIKCGTSFTGGKAIIPFTKLRLTVTFLNEKISN